MHLLVDDLWIPAAEDPRSTVVALPRFSGKTSGIHRISRKGERVSRGRESREEVESSPRWGRKDAATARGGG